MPGMIWTTETDQKLLIYLLATNPKIKLDFEGAAKMLTNKNRNCTARAVQEHFKKIKKIVQSDEKWVFMAEQAAVGHGAKPTPQSKSGKRVHQEADEDDDDEAEEHPSTKKRALLNGLKSSSQGSNTTADSPAKKNSQTHEELENVDKNGANDFEEDQDEEADGEENDGVVKPDESYNSDAV